MTIAAVVAAAPLRRGSTGSAVELVQIALQAAGHELVLDGDYGAITDAAVRRFQAANNLEVDGVVGPKTAVALDAVKIPVQPKPPLPSALTIAPWLATMRAITGLKEVPGAADSPIILSWNKVIATTAPDLAAYSKTYTHDSIPWCGQGMAYALAANGIHPVAGYLWAANWGVPGEHLIKLKPPYPLGAIMTFLRQGGGHVALNEGVTKTHYIIRGCNQTDMVNVVQRQKDSSFIAATWPTGFPLPGAKPVVADAGNVPVSGKES